MLATTITPPAGKEFCLDRLCDWLNATLGLVFTNLTALALFHDEVSAFEASPSSALDATSRPPSSGAAAAVSSHTPTWLDLISPSPLIFAAGSSVLAVFVLGMYWASHRRQARELKWRAHHDVLTELPNRWTLEKRLEWLVNRRHGTRRSSAALLWIDLDDFKSANDALGHQGGDAVLVTVAERLRKCLGNTDTLARFGGDEFVILANRPETGGYDQALALARRALETLSVPMAIAGRDVVLFASIGVVLLPEHGMDAKALLANANQVARRVKRGGGNNCRLFRGADQDDGTEGLVIRSALTSAVAQDELTLLYQPVVNVATGEIKGVEALLRWRHPTLGLVSPETFIPVAEDSGLIVSIGAWVLREACRQLAEWQCQDLPAVRMAVNLSPRQLNSTEVVNTVASALRDNGLRGEQLELEVTEGAIMWDFEQATANMSALRKRGVGFSVDDFGTGYSSLNYLKLLPVTRLKIDKSFIHQIPVDGDDRVIAGAIIAMAHSLGLAVIAEGAETQAQLDFLRARDCEEVQGYYVCEPVSGGELASLLRRERSLAGASTDGI